LIERVKLPNGAALFNSGRIAAAASHKQTYK